MKRIKLTLIRWLTENDRLDVERAYNKARNAMQSNPKDRNAETVWLLVDAQRQFLRKMRDEL